MWGLLIILCCTQEISCCEDIVTLENMLSLTDKLAERCNIKKPQHLSSVTVRLYATGRFCLVTLCFILRLKHP